MDYYFATEVIGEGTFGRMTKAVDMQSGQLVAVKTIKQQYKSWKELVYSREIKALQRLNHPNIVKLKEIIAENHTVHFVFEFVESNVLELIQRRKNLMPESQVRNLCFQLLQGLNYMHQQGYFHRDLKPQNLLVSKDNVVKIADLASAREIHSSPPYTEYITKRSYRAPEVLLREQMYGPKVDMWAVGAIMAELFTLRPLFRSRSSIDQIYTICRKIRSPTMESWPRGMALAKAINLEFPKSSGAPVSLLVPCASQDAISLITQLCSWDPDKRPSCMEALAHPFFRSCYIIPVSLPSLSSMVMELLQEQNQKQRDEEVQQQKATLLIETNSSNLARWINKRDGRPWILIKEFRRIDSLMQQFEK